MSKADSDFRRFPDPSNNELVRQSIAEMNIIGSRLMGLIVTDEENYRRAGYSNAVEFWNVALSESMEASDFAGFLSKYFFDPKPHALNSSPKDLAEIGIKAALRDALKAYEPWFVQASIGPDKEVLQGVVLHPREAAEWLLSKPRRRHLVPEGLREYLEHSTEKKPAKAREPLARGPKPKVRSRVDAEMRDFAVSDLRSMTEEAMSAQFKTSRDTARKARNKVLSEIDNSDN